MLLIFPKARKAMRDAFNKELFRAMWDVSPILKEIRTRPQVEGHEQRSRDRSTTARAASQFPARTEQVSQDHESQAARDRRSVSHTNASTVA
jgi:hypothetical protein